MMNVEILYGFHPVREAIRAGRRKVQTVYLSREALGHRSEDILTIAKSSRIPVENTTTETLKSLARTEQHQGFCAKVSPYPALTAEDLSDIVSTAESPAFLLVIDSVVDPHNLGALLRSALATGVQGVMIPKDRSAPPTPTVSKASAGALEHIQLARVTNISRELATLQKQGLWVFGLDRSAPETIFQADLTGPIALVVGGEEKGIRPLVRQHCDRLISIPQLGPLDSLNASVAGAVAMFEVLRRRIV
jgi:23S rRNA (guanosine2251-2'-O)-methyltransferase